MNDFIDAMRYFVLMENARKEKEKKMFTKKDLRTGDVILDERGEKAKVFLNTFAGDVIVFEDSSYLELGDITKETFRFLKREGNDFTKIYSLSSFEKLFSYTTFARDLVWEREEETVKTIAEIEEATGWKNLKIKGE